MNYFQRLIKRAKAEASNSQGALYDPFTKVESDPVQWPQTQSAGKKFNEESSVSVPPTTSPVENKPESEETAERQKRELKQKKLEPTEKKVEVQVNAPAQPVKSKEEQQKTVDNPQVLNQTPGIGIIDQIMEPYINSFKPEEKKLSAKEEKHEEKNPRKRHQTKPGKIAQTIKPVSQATQVTDKTVKSITPKEITPEVAHPKKKQSTKQLSINEMVEKKILEVEEKLIKKTQPTSLAQQQNSVVLVKQTTTRNGERKSVGSGSPHIGIGQL